MAIGSIPKQWPRMVAAGVGAGIVGGIAIDAFLYIVLLLPAHQPITLVWQAISLAATGHTVASPWLGLLLHFCVSIAWGIGYAYAAFMRPAIAGRPYISGPVFGLIVMLLIQLVQLVAGVKVPAISVRLLITFIFGYSLFFGLPVALYVHRALRT